MDNDKRKQSDKQEKRIARMLKGFVTANSGAGIFDKGDVKAKYMLIEAKTLMRPQKVRSIKKDWLVRVEQHAFSRGFKMSALCIDFGDGEDFFVMNRNDFTELYECYIRLMEIEEEDGD